MVNNNKEAWQKFIRLSFISLGVGFTVSGIIFFFAYNWNDLHKFAKIGIVEILLVASTALVIYPKLNGTVKNIILTGSAALAGALFAVFGQVYQTGANAYDLFFIWTLSVTLWAIVANFTPLWLIYLALINTTFILYAQQVANDWSWIFVYAVLFIFNTCALIAFVVLPRYNDKIKAPVWFTNTIAFSSVVYATIGMISWIAGWGEESSYSLWLISLSVIAFYALGIKYGLQTKRLFYLSIIPASVIVMIVTMLIQSIDNLGEEAGFLFISLFIIMSVTALVAGLIHIQRQWNNNGE
jgi:uncharacterized membrane protein